MFKQSSVGRIVKTICAFSFMCGEGNEVTAIDTVVKGEKCCLRPFKLPGVGDYSVSIVWSFSQNNLILQLFVGSCVGLCLCSTVVAGLQWRAAALVTYPSWRPALFSLEVRPILHRMAGSNWEQAALGYLPISAIQGAPQGRYKKFCNRSGEGKSKLSPSHCQKVLSNPRNFYVYSINMYEVAHFLPLRTAKAYRTTHAALVRIPKIALYPLHITCNAYL